MASKAGNDGKMSVSLAESGWPPTVRETINRLRAVTRDLQSRFTARDRAIDLLVLGTVCQEHVLLVGPPGTAKTKLIAEYATQLDATKFSYMLTRFTEPTELFGPVDVEAFREGHYRIRTEKMLPEAQVVFLDEVFRGSSAILNSLLTILNEHVFYNGSDQQPVPLLLMAGATNEIPSDSALVALADRFLLRIELARVSDQEFDLLLDMGWDLEREQVRKAVQAAHREHPVAPSATVPVRDVIELLPRILEVGLSGIRPEYSQMIREMRAEGIQLSDRRAVKGLKLVAGAALLRGAVQAEFQDFWPLQHLWTSTAETEQLAAIVGQRLQSAGRARQPVRPVADVLFELDTLVAKKSDIRSDASLGAFLMALNALRRELARNYPDENEARRRIDEVIHAVLQQLEPAYV